MQWLAWICLSWIGIFCADCLLRAKSKRYERFLENSGLFVSLFQIKWHGSRLTTVLDRCALFRQRPVRRFLTVWFGLGSLVSICCLLAMFSFLSYTLYAALLPVYESQRWRVNMLERRSLALMGNTDLPVDSDTAERVEQVNQQQQQQQPRMTGLVAVVPGLNVPAGEVPLFLVTLALAAIIHELGHAMAALNDNVSVSGFGLYFLVAFPAALTELDTDGLDRLTTRGKLRVYCGGIWHNLVLADATYLLLLCLPALFSPMYRTGKGVTVMAVDPESGLAGPTGLQPETLLYAINWCNVRDEEDWFGCLRKEKSKNYGYCVPKKDVLDGRIDHVWTNTVQGELRCCDHVETAKNTSSSASSHLCFYYKSNQKVQYSCMSARYATDHYQMCNSSLPCARLSRTVCVYPALFNGTRLFRFLISTTTTSSSSLRNKPVLFVGFAEDVIRSVTVSKYAARLQWPSATLPDMAELSCKYLLSLSLGLGLLNAVPCFYLDGQFILCSLIDSLFTWPRQRRRALRLCILFVGTGVLVANVLIAFANLIKNYI